MAQVTEIRYHLELTPAQLKITHTALHSLLDDFGHEQSAVMRVIREVLEKLPDDHAIRAIELDAALRRSEISAVAPEGPDSEPDDNGGAPPSIVA